MNLTLNSNVSHNNAYTFVSVSGCIGAGKTTAIELFKELVNNGEELHYVFFKENIDLWTNFRGSNMLDLFYKDKKKWAFTFQMFILHVYNRELNVLIADAEESKRINPKMHTIIVSERSPLDQFYIFCTNLYEQGYMEKEQYHTIELYHENSLKPHWFLYVRVNPLLSLKRIQERNRSFENKVDEEYFRSIHDQYEKFVKILMKDGYNSFVLLNNNGDIDSLKGRIRRIIHMLEKSLLQ